MPGRTDDSNVPRRRRMLEERERLAEDPAVDEEDVAVRDRIDRGIEAATEARVGERLRPRELRPDRDPGPDPLERAEELQRERREEAAQEIREEVAKEEGELVDPEDVRVEFEEDEDGEVTAVPVLGDEAVERIEAHRREEVADELREEVAAEDELIDPDDVRVEFEETDDGELEARTEVDPDAIERIEARQREQAAEELREEVAAEDPLIRPEDVDVDVRDDELRADVPEDILDEIRERDRAEIEEELREEVAEEHDRIDPDDVFVDFEEDDDGLRAEAEVDPDVLEEIEAEQRAEIEAEIRRDVAEGDPEAVREASRQLREGEIDVDEYRDIIEEAQPEIGWAEPDDIIVEWEEEVTEDVRDLVDQLREGEIDAGEFRDRLREPQPVVQVDPEVQVERFQEQSPIPYPLSGTALGVVELLPLREGPVDQQLISQILGRDPGSGRGATGLDPHEILERIDVDELEEVRAADHRENWGPDPDMVREAQAELESLRELADEEPDEFMRQAAEEADFLAEMYASIEHQRERAAAEHRIRRDARQDIAEATEGVDVGDLHLRDIEVDMPVGPGEVEIGVAPDAQERIVEEQIRTDIAERDEIIDREDVQVDLVDGEPVVDIDPGVQDEIIDRQAVEFREELAAEDPRIDAEDIDVEIEDGVFRPELDDDVQAELEREAAMEAEEVGIERAMRATGVGVGPAPVADPTADWGPDFLSAQQIDETIGGIQRELEAELGEDAPEIGMADVEFERGPAGAVDVGFDEDIQREILAQQLDAETEFDLDEDDIVLEDEDGEVTAEIDEDVLEAEFRRQIAAEHGIDPEEIDIEIEDGEIMAEAEVVDERGLRDVIDIDVDADPARVLQRFRGEETPPVVDVDIETDFEVPGLDDLDERPAPPTAIDDFESEVISRVTGGLPEDIREAEEEELGPRETREDEFIEGIEEQFEVETDIEEIVDEDQLPTQEQLAMAGVAGVATPEPVTGLGGAAVLGGLTLGAIAADVARRQEVDIPRDRVEEVGIGAMIPEAELDVDEPSVEEIGIGEGIVETEVEIEEPIDAEIDITDQVGEIDDVVIDDTVVPDEFPMPGRDFPRDAREDIVRQPDIDDILDAAPAFEPAIDRELVEEDVEDRLMDEDVQEALEQFEETQRRIEGEFTLPAREIPEPRIEQEPEVVDRPIEPGERIQPGRREDVVVRQPLAEILEEEGAEPEVAEQIERAFETGEEAVIGRERTRVEEVQRPEVLEQVEDLERLGVDPVGRAPTAAPIVEERERLEEAFEPAVRIDDTLPERDAALPEDVLLERELERLEAAQRPLVEERPVERLDLLERVMEDAQERVDVGPDEMVLEDTALLEDVDTDAMLEEQLDQMAEPAEATEALFEEEALVETEQALEHPAEQITEITQPTVTEQAFEFTQPTITQQGFIHQFGIPPYRIPRPGVERDTDVFGEAEDVGMDDEIFETEILDVDDALEQDFGFDDNADGFDFSVGNGR